MSDPQTKPRHLDRRAMQLLESREAEGDGDELLTTRQIADWYGVSEQWLTIGRVRGYGPPFVRLAGKIVRYRRDAARQFLLEREYRRTSEYAGADDDQR